MCIRDRSKDPLPQALGLVAMDVADSDALNIGDELDVIGFPGIGGDTVTYTEGTVAGFLDEDNNGICLLYTSRCV